MAYRLKQQVDIIWLTEPMTIVTEWKRGFNGQPIPKQCITGQAGMALVVVTAPNGKQHKHFATREEVETHFEEEAAPEHVQAETTHAPFITPWWQWIQPGTQTYRSPLDPPYTITNETKTNATAWGNGDKSILPRDGFYVEPPEAGKAV